MSQKTRVQDVGIGGAGNFQGDLLENGKSDRGSAVKRVGVQVGLKRGEQNQQKAEKCDGEKQTVQGICVFHMT